MGATVMNNEPRKAIHKILEKPIEQWIEEFKEMNDSDMYTSLKELGIDTKHPLMMSDEELTKRNTNISKEKDNVLKAIKKRLGL